MRFRTEIEPTKALQGISHDTPVVLLGSCFTDEIGSRLERDGFEVMHNPFGPLYNPQSLLTCIKRALEGQEYTAADLTPGSRGFHCLDYAMRYSGDDADVLLLSLNSTLTALADALRRQPTVILTLGTAYVYRYLPTGKFVGNCHKFSANDFSRELMSVDDCFYCISGAAKLLARAGVRQLIVTVSPIRHTGDGLHGNNISKSTLLLAADKAVGSQPDFISYFPSYEMLIDDLRDYRFYASDMKHPSEVAVDYIYRHFSDTFFNQQTRDRALEARRLFLAAQHRPIL